jgi:hypothetical protein
MPLLPLAPATSDTPIGTLVVLIDDGGRPHLTRTRSSVWELDATGKWMIMVDGRTGGYLLSRIFVLPDLGQLT